PSARLEALQSGLCHLMSAPSPRDLEAIKRDPKLKLVSQPGLNVSYLAMNTKKAPLDNVRVRQAIAHALNRSRYVEVVFGGNAQVAKNPIPPIMWSYHRSAKDYAYNTERAKEILKEIKMDGGFKTALWYGK